MQVIVKYHDCYPLEDGTVEVVSDMYGEPYDPDEYVTPSDQVRRITESLRRRNVTSYAVSTRNDDDRITGTTTGGHNRHHPHCWSNPNRHTEPVDYATNRRLSTYTNDQFGG